MGEKLLKRIGPNPFGKYVCPCCGYHTLAGPEPGSYEVCPVCFWEDDPVQWEDVNYEGGANRPSLTQARLNVRQFGACDEAAREDVRPAAKEELPRHNW